MAILEHFHTAQTSGDAAWDIYMGYVCGGPYATDRQQKRFRHAKSCLRARKPFIRLVLHELGSEYVCYGCKRAWAIPEPYFGDRRDRLRLVVIPADWWGWRHAQALEVTTPGYDGPSIWVQECGKGVAHLQNPWGFSCGRSSMDRAMSVNGVPVKTCKRCAT